MPKPAESAPTASVESSTKIAAAAASSTPVVASKPVTFASTVRSYSFADLSKEISLRIFALLSDPKDLARVSLICKTWRKYLAEEEQNLWKSMYGR